MRGQQQYFSCLQENRAGRCRVTCPYRQHCNNKGGWSRNPSTTAAHSPAAAGRMKRLNREASGGVTRGRTDPQRRSNPQETCCWRQQQQQVTDRHAESWASWWVGKETAGPQPGPQGCPAPVYTSGPGVLPIITTETYALISRVTPPGHLVGALHTPAPSAHSDHFLGTLPKTNGCGAVFPRSAQWYRTYSLDCSVLSAKELENCLCRRKIFVADKKEKKKTPGKEVVFL